MDDFPIPRDMLTVPPLDGGNYYEWRRAVLRLVRYKNLEWVLQPTVSESGAFGASDRAAHALISATLLPWFQRLVEGEVTAATMWAALEAEFKARCAHALASNTRALYSITMGPMESVASYLMRAADLQLRVKDGGGVVLEAIYVALVVDGLRSSRFAT